MSLAAMPPAVEKSPPAYNVLPDTASAYTPLSIPEPTGDQLLPFHRATAPEMTAYNVLPDTASADTPPLIPEPGDDQVLPFHFAMLLIAPVGKSPPAYTVLPDTASADTPLPPTPAPLPDP